MPNSKRSWRGCAPCGPAEGGAVVRWRPSRWLSAALVALTTGAAAAVLASGAPPVLAWPLAGFALLHGGLRLRRQARAGERVLRFRPEGRVEVDGEPVEAFRLDWRGPLAFARWRDAAGRTHRLAWWPDTLPPRARRELRLAAPVPRAARDAPSMAP